LAETLNFDRRYQGFGHGALGGYAAGVVAGRIDGPAEANLRSLPPMERDLELREGEDGKLELWDGETLVLDARPAEFELGVAEPPTPEEARQAGERPVHEELSEHPYPGCFTCGPAREEGDALRLFVGRHPAGAPFLASGWTPHAALASDRGDLPSELVWAALDCPTIWAAWSESRPAAPPAGTFTVLARQRLEHLRPVPVGEALTVTAWPIEHEGRKRLSGAAIHDADGALLARCESLLVEVPIREPASS
jgi:hypothetical protein